MKLPPELLKFYSINKKKIKNRLLEFSKVPKDDYFYELCYCLLTPQSKAEYADNAVNTLKKIDFLHKDINPAPILSNPKNYIRFHNNKSKHLLHAKNIFPHIMECLEDSTDQYQKREKLVQIVLGYGMKESSHFLRNIGFRNLAILDRHILKNLSLLNVIDEIPKTLTKNIYIEIEQKFLHFANNINIPIDELDLLFWSFQTGKILK